MINNLYWSEITSPKGSFIPGQLKASEGKELNATAGISLY